jgi:hypothetical protein
VGNQGIFSLHGANRPQAREEEMAIIGFIETGLLFGTIDTSATAPTSSTQHNFPFPGVTVWSRPYVQSFFNNADDGSVSLGVAQFTDNKGTHSGVFHPGIFASNCTSVIFHMRTTDCIAEAVFTSEIFG